MARPVVRTRQLVAGNVRRIRLAQGLSQEKLGAIAGVHRTFVGHVERAETNVSIDTLDRLADALSVEPASFFEPLPSRPESSEQSR